MYSSEAERTKSSMMISSIENKPLFSMIYTILFQRRKG